MFIDSKRGRDKIYIYFRNISQFEIKDFNSYIQNFSHFFRRCLLSLTMIWRRECFTGVVTQSHTHRSIDSTSPVASHGAALLVLMLGRASPTHVASFVHAHCLAACITAFLAVRDPHGCTRSTRTRMEKCTVIFGRPLLQILSRKISESQQIKQKIDFKKFINQIRRIKWNNLVEL